MRVRRTARNYAQALYRYTRGGCHVLAMALYKELRPLGWKLAASPNGRAHAFVVSPCGEFCADIKGVQHGKDMIEYWGWERDLEELVYDDVDQFIEETSDFSEGRVYEEELDTETHRWAAWVAGNVVTKWDGKRSMAYVKLPDRKRDYLRQELPDHLLV